MAATNFDLSTLSPFSHAAAGHEGVLSDPTDSLVIKPCYTAEINFYETCAASHPALNAIIPTYMGTLALSTTAPPESATASHHTTQDPIPATIEIGEGGVTAVLGIEKGRKLETETAIVLENVAAGYARPNIMDVKLGARLWADDASEEKKVKFDKVSKETTSGSLGLRITGMRVWRVTKGGEGHYQEYGKTFGRQFTAEDVRKGFEEFFYKDAGDGTSRQLTSSMREVVRRLSNEVATIEDVLEDEETRMFSSSILLVYEGEDNTLDAMLREEENSPRPRKRLRAELADETDSNADAVEDDEEEEDEDEDEDEEESRTCAAALIDFGHASFVPGEGKDENVLQGVRSLRTILDNILLEA